jgi:hypothetical protein
MNKTLFLRILFIWIFFVISSPAWSSVIYTYTGNNFDTFPNAPSVAPTHDTTMGVTATLEFANLLPADIDAYFSLNLTNFSISDGVNTIDNSNFSSGNLRVGTDSSGNIDEWFLFAVANTTNEQWYIETINFPSSISLIWDYGRVGLNNTLGDIAYIKDAAGSWTVTSVPEPASIALMGLGLISLGVARRRNKA